MQFSFLPDIAEDPEIEQAVVVYTDGGCDPNPGPGGWAAVLLMGDREVALQGSAPQATNNRMELEAAISALAYLLARHGPLTIDMHTDSQYLRRGITQWMDGWFARGWKTKTGEPVRNQDLWRRLYQLAHHHQVRWHWVRGHAGDRLNERVDQMAREARAWLSGGAHRDGVADSASSSLPTPQPGAPVGPSVELAVAVSCQNDAGSWAAVLHADGLHQVLCGRESETTSNALLLRAATEGLSALSATSEVTVLTDSDYLGKGGGQWVHDWQQRQWRTRSGKPVQNREGWEALLQAAQRHRVHWQVVRGDLLPSILVEAKERAALETPPGTAPRQRAAGA